MEKERTIFDRLDSIEKNSEIAAKQSLINNQILTSLNNNQTNSNQVRSVSEQQSLENFLKSSRKIYRFFGPSSVFAYVKRKTLLLFIILSGTALLSSIVTSITAKIYTTFTFFENIIFFINLSYFLKFYQLGITVGEDDYRSAHIEKFTVASYNQKIPTGSLRKGYFIFSILGYLGSILNIIWFFVERNKAGLIVLGILFEVLFVVALFLFQSCLRDNLNEYGICFFTKMNPVTNERTTFVRVVCDKSIYTYKDFEEKYKRMLN